MTVRISSGEGADTTGAADVLEDAGKDGASNSILDGIMLFLGIIVCLAAQFFLLVLAYFLTLRALLSLPLSLLQAIGNRWDSLKSCLSCCCCSRGATTLDEVEGDGEGDFVAVNIEAAGLQPLLSPKKSKLWRCTLSTRSLRLIRLAANKESA